MGDLSKLVSDEESALRDRGNISSHWLSLDVNPRCGTDNPGRADGVSAERTNAPLEVRLRASATWERSSPYVRQSQDFGRVDFFYRAWFSFKSRPILYVSN